MLCLAHWSRWHPTGVHRCRNLIGRERAGGSEERRTQLFPAGVRQNGRQRENGDGENGRKSVPRITAMGPVFEYAQMFRLSSSHRMFHRSAGSGGAREQGRKQGGREVERILSIIVLHRTVKTRPGRQSAQDLSKDSKRCSMSGLHRRARRSAEDRLKDIRAA